MTALVVAAFIALAAPAIAQQCCGDCDGDGEVTINEVITSVNAGLHGCDMLPDWSYRLHVAPSADSPARHECVSR